MDPLIREALAIEKDISGVVLIGAAAVILHTKIGRSSEDLDFALTIKLSDNDIYWTKDT
jgi:hypothetical protein